MAETYQSAGEREFFRFLCRAAGVDTCKVRSIECRCDMSSVVSFKIELIGTPAVLKAALASREA